MPLTTHNVYSYHNVYREILGLVRVLLDSTQTVSILGSRYYDHHVTLQP